jgi:hypothetical protein
LLGRIEYLSTKTELETVNGNGGESPEKTERLVHGAKKHLYLLRSGYKCPKYY